MADLRIFATEEMVGAGHATKTDTLNRHFLAGGMRTSEGKSNWETFVKQTSDPSTGADEGGLFAKNNADGDLALHWRRPSDGAIVELGPRIRAVETGVHTPSWTSTYYSYISLATDGLDATKHLPFLFADKGSSGYGWWWKLDVANSRIVVTRGYSVSGPDEVFWQLLEVPSGYTLEQGESTVSCLGSNWGSTNISLNHNMSDESYLMVLGKWGSNYAHHNFTTNTVDCAGIRVRKHATDADKIVGGGMGNGSATDFNNLTWAVITP